MASASFRIRSNCSSVYCGTQLDSPERGSQRHKAANPITQASNATVAYSKSRRILRQRSSY
jgi:hypothetical protein